MPLPIILASSSPYRRQLLDRLALDYCAIGPNIDETAITGELAHSLAQRLSVAKAKALAVDYPAHLIIGSDQAASLGSEIIGKPGNHSAALTQLQQCNGRSLVFYTGLCLLNSQTQQIQTCVESYTVQFRTLSTAQIERYLVAEQPYDCAGSFKAERLGIALFEKLIGDDPNSLIGLPLIRLVELFSNEGVAIP